MDKTNPKHYRDAAITLEPIDLCELLGFNLGNAVKYIVRTVHGLTLVSFGGRLSFAEEERNRRLERERLKAEEAKREAEEEKSMRVERIEKGRMQAEKIRIMAAPSPNWFDAIVCAGDAHA